MQVCGQGGLRMFSDWVVIRVRNRGLPIAVYVVVYTQFELTFPLLLCFTEAYRIYKENSRCSWLQQ